MTDEQIIKALKCCGKRHNEKNDAYCNECKVDNCLTCVAVLCDRTLGLINRQNAEIERLQNEIGSLNKAYPCTVKMNDNCLVYARSLDDYDNLIGDISAEGIKEFWNKLKTHSRKMHGEDFGGSFWDRAILVEDGNNLVKEITEE